VNAKFKAALAVALGDNQTHIIRCQESTYTSRSGKRHAFVFMNHISPDMREADPKEAVRFQTQGSELADLDQVMLAACLEARKNVSIMFRGGFADAHDFLGDCFDAAEATEAGNAS